MKMGSHLPAGVEPDPLDAGHLNASPNPGHFSYKLLGMISWGVLVFSFVCLVLAPHLLLDIARVVALYMTVRLVAFMVFYLAGLIRVRQAEKRLKAGGHDGVSNPDVTGNQAVHHLVILPNFKEPQEILSRTLHFLSLMPQACDSITVVLAMEEREPEARVKAESLLAQYENRFYRLLATFHPANLPGEAPGKGMNDTWAVRTARRELVDRLGIPPDRVVVTVADSDAILHPGYFTELSRQFSLDPLRYSILWQPPILLGNDIWRAHPPIRLMTFFSNAISVGDYVNPLEAKFPYSTYSLSLKLLEEVDYWDPTLIAEDVNIYMRAFFKKGGKVSLRHLYLPVHCNPVYGASLWHSFGIFYAQKVREGWGGAEIGYLVQKWNVPPRAPFLYKLGRLIKLFHDHLFFSIAGFLVALGTLLSILLDHNPVITLPTHSSYTPLFALLNLLGASALVVIWFTERIRWSRGWSDWNLKTLAGEVASWMIFPLLFFLMMNLPGLQAQTSMLLGHPFSFNRTPKKFDSRMGE